MKKFFIALAPFVLMLGCKTSQNNATTASSQQQAAAPVPCQTAELCLKESCSIVSKNIELARTCTSEYVINETLEKIEKSCSVNTKDAAATLESLRNLSDDMRGIKRILLKKDVSSECETVREEQRINIVRDETTVSLNYTNTLNRSLQNKRFPQ